MEKLFYEKNFLEYEPPSMGKLILKYSVILLCAILLIGAFLGYRFYFVAGWSMQPVIDYMDLIIINQNVDKYNLQVGDIITFDYGIINTHRIIDVKYEDGVITYTTKGDNPNITEQEHPTPDKIIGKVVTISGNPIVIPKIGYYVDDLQNHKLLFVVYIVLMYMFFFVTPTPKKYVGYEP